MLRYLTAGESHGPALTAIVEGLPAGLPLTAAYINRQLARRQGGYGRGARMKIESDTVSFLSGVRGGLTLGSPLALLVENEDWANWSEIMSAEPGARTDERVVRRPRPGTPTWREPQIPASRPQKRSGTSQRPETAARVAPAAWPGGFWRNWELPSSGRSSSWAACLRL